MGLAKFKKWYQTHKTEICEDYFSLLRFASISTDPAYKKDVLACANWVLEYLKRSHISARLLETPIHPLVYAEEIQDPKLPTLLIYGHYDVQPVDPLEEWDHDPFDPYLENTKVTARGAQDNKGQLMYVLAATRALKEISSKPFNVKLIIEGEEECASNGLSLTLEKYKDLLACDDLLIVDMDIPDKSTPAVTVGCRGLYSLGIELTAANIDLHSGMHGGIVCNPNTALVQLLSRLWDEKKRIQVPHFYDDVISLSEYEEKELSLKFDKKAYQKQYDIHSFWHEEGVELRASNWLRPTMEINGIAGGYFGKGFKTVIPQKALAKLSCRLVPNQDPKKIGENLKKFLHSELIQGMKINIEEYGEGLSARADLHSHLLSVVSKAYEEVFNRVCKKVLSGGSIPIAADLAKALSANVLFMGTGLASDNIHAPNENFDLKRLEQGFYIVGRTIEMLGEKNGS